jgi:cellulose synthase/poly-beta-1,6-N-acetylglucosamine synthase-like glycosyltransferase
MLMRQSHRTEQGTRVDAPRERLAVLVPCCNEEASIAQVVSGFHAALPEATIYVYDNNSTDGTMQVAQAAGAAVRREVRQGKGHVVRRMFAEVETDIYLLVDGDATYDAPSARQMVDQLVEENLDMVVGARVSARRLRRRAATRLLLAGPLSALPPARRATGVPGGKTAPCWTQRLRPRLEIG